SAGARMVGQAVSHERDGQAEDAAHAKAGGESVEGKIHPTFRKSGEAGANGIQQNGKGECLRAANTITYRAKDEAARCPAGDEDGGRVTAVKLYIHAGGQERFHSAVA